MNAGWQRSLVVASLIAPMLLAACSDAPTEPEQQQPTFARSFYFGAAQLEVVRYHQPRDGARVTRTIGRSGGFISAPGVMLVIPAGALDRNVDITMTIPEGDRLGVELEPHGLTFKRPAYLAFVLSNTDYSADNASVELSGTYHTDGVDASVVTPREVMQVYMMNGLAAFGVWHFSDYAVTKQKGLILVGG
jgi:hypothetical protein